MKPPDLVRSGGLVLGGAALGALSNLALATVVGRGLGPTATGTFFAVVGAFVVASNVLELGADTGLVRMMARLRALGRNSEIRRTILVAVIPVVVVGVTAAVVLWTQADNLAGVLGSAEDRSERAQAYRLLAPLVPFGSLLAVSLGGIRGMGAVAPVVAIQNVFIPVSRLAVVGVLLAWGAGVVAVLQWWAVALPAGVIIAALVLGRQVARAKPFELDTSATRRPGPISREFWSFAGPRAVAAAVEIVLEWVDVLAVAILLGPREAGVYAIVTRAVRVGQLVEQAARLVVAPHVSALASSGRATSLNALYETVTRVLVGLAMPFYTTLIVFAPVALSLFGPGFVEGRHALRVAAAGMALALSAGALQSVILMAGKSSWQVQNKVAALLTIIVSLWFLVPTWGIVGAAAAWVAAISVDTWRAAVQVRRLGVALVARETLLVAVTAVVLFGSVGAATAALLPGWPGLVAHLAVAGSCYVLVIWRRRTLWLRGLRVPWDDDEPGVQPAGGDAPSASRRPAS